MSESSPQQSLRRLLRLLLVLAFVFLSLLIILLVLQLTESALSIWQMLDNLSPTLLVFYGIGLIGFTVVIAVISWMLLKPRQPAMSTAADEAMVPVDRDALEAAMAKAAESGVDTNDAREEILELDRRQEGKAHYIAFFGAVSAGKSALIKAITGHSEISVDPRAGTTREITHYQFDEDEVQDLILTDAPGILDLDRERVRLAREEARRADLVIYVSDGELTRDQYEEVNELLRFDRPMVLALNKQDRYSETDLAAIIGRLREQLPDIRVIPVVAGGEESVMRVDTEGRETSVTRARTPQIDGLMHEIRKRVADEGERLTQQRDESLLRLGAEKLTQAEAAHRRERSERLVKQYAQKAMVGAMAAVSPGTDVLIQGYLGVKMVQELTRLYGVRVQQADLEQFVSMASQHVGKRLTLLLALTGNVLKAFPGVGTVTGGLLHAVAYGMIFEGLGEAVARTLHEKGSLTTGLALDYFEETISGNLEGRAKHFARLALEELTGKR
ncbi:MAG: GTP-binding protein [Candidatus Thiodiazotropha sp. (ex Monitilora ramsayi)]|nr:GTP-binding protein [Candidatus Thiodiazotropha sp. (ex Monitilora ramsayi)]